MSNFETTRLVHHEGEEGTIQIDALTGIITTPGHERPEWANGLSTALLNERYGFYFGTESTAPRLDKEAHEASILNGPIAYQDLGWVAMDEEQQPVEIEADHEWRMNHLATLLGIDRTDFDAKLGDAEADIYADNSRTPEEVETLTKMQGTDFEPATAEERTAQTG